MYISGIRLFLSEHFIVPHAIEVPVYSSELLLAGTPDLVCGFDSQLSILDYKFVSQVDKTRAKAQLNAYRRLYECAEVFIENLLVVQFLNDGGYRIYPVALDYDEIEWCLKGRELKSKKHPRGLII